MPIGALSFGERALWCAFGCALQLFMSPDMDINGYSAPKSNLNYIPVIGFIPMYIWMMLWHPYSYAFSHRGISHWHIVGTVTRVSYLAILCIFIFCCYSFDGDLDSIINSAQHFASCVIQYAQEIVFIFIGLAIADEGHIARDRTGIQL